MSKYDRLHKHLAALDVSEWEASFADIERILGFALPSSALKYPPWWANQTGSGHVQSNAWQAAGWRSKDLDLTNQTVKFERVGFRPPPAQAGIVLEAMADQGLTIAQAKVGLARYFGLSTDDIEINIRA
jgi:hypothetical protein